MVVPPNTLATGEKRAPRAESLLIAIGLVLVVFVILVFYIETPIPVSNEVTQGGAKGVLLWSTKLGGEEKVSSSYFFDLTTKDKGPVDRVAAEVLAAPAYTASGALAQILKDGSGVLEIRVTNADGDLISKLTTKDRGEVGEVAIAPDGTHFAYSFVPEAAGVQFEAPLDLWLTVMYDLTRSDAEPIYVNGRSPIFVGTSLIYIGKDGVYTLTKGGEVPHKLNGFEDTSIASRLTAAVSAPFFAFWNQTAAEDEIQLYELNGADVRKVSTVASAAQRVVLSPDGRYIAIQYIYENTERLPGAGKVIIEDRVGGSTVRGLDLKRYVEDLTLSAWINSKP